MPLIPLFSSPLAPSDPIAGAARAIATAGWAQLPPTPRGNSIGVAGWLREFVPGELPIGDDVDFWILAGCPIIWRLPSRSVNWQQCEFSTTWEVPLEQ